MSSKFFHKPFNNPFEISLFAIVPHIFVFPSSDCGMSRSGFLLFGRFYSKKKILE